MVHWQSESDLDSIRNSCDVFIPIEYINTIYSPFGWHFSRIKFADFSLRGVGGGTSKLALLPPLTHTKKNPPIKELHSFQIPNCAPDTWKRKAACRLIIIVTISIGCGSQSSKGECYRKKAPFVEYCIWIVFSECQGRAGEKWGKPCHSLTFCKGICDMCHENAKIFRYMFSSIRKPQTIRIIIGQTGSMRRERGGDWEYRGCLGAESWLPARQKKALWHCVRSVSLCPRCLLCHSSRSLLVFSSSTTFRRAVPFLGNTPLLELYQALLLHPS